MPLGQAIALGVVQGVAEFLPISSSGHLILVRSFMGWGEAGGLYFDIALHAGTLLALIAYFWRDWARLLAAAVNGPEQEKRMFWLLVIATIPGAIVGKLLEKAAEEAFRNPALVGTTLAVVGVLMGVADHLGKKSRGLKELTLRDAVLVGCAQAFAIVPGVSRAGSTMSAALAVGFDREASARFSFLMATPIIFGAVVVGTGHLRHEMLEPGMGAALVAGVVTSAIVGLAAIHGLLAYLRRRSFDAFVAYRVALGVIVVGLTLAGKLH